MRPVSLSWVVHNRKMGLAQIEGRSKLVDSPKSGHVMWHVTCSIMLCITYACTLIRMRVPRLVYLD